MMRARQPHVLFVHLSPCRASPLGRASSGELTVTRWLPTAALPLRVAPSHAGCTQALGAPPGATAGGRSNSATMSVCSTTKLGGFGREFTPARARA